MPHSPDWWIARDMERAKAYARSYAGVGDPNLPPAPDPIGLLKQEVPSFSQLPPNIQQSIASSANFNNLSSQWDGARDSIAKVETGIVLTIDDYEKMGAAISTYAAAEMAAVTTASEILAIVGIITVAIEGLIFTDALMWWGIQKLGWAASGSMSTACNPLPTGPDDPQWTVAPPMAVLRQGGDPDPRSPDWVAPSTNGHPTLPDQVWLPASDGDFEHWIRPLIMWNWELGVNCRRPVPFPPEQVVAYWNMMHDGGTTRQICAYQPLPNVQPPGGGFAAIDRKQLDPIQQFFFPRYTDANGQPGPPLPASTCITINTGLLKPRHVGLNLVHAFPPVKGTPPPAAPSTTSATATKVALGGAAVAGTGAIAVFLYSQATGMAFTKAVEMLWGKATGLIKSNPIPSATPYKRRELVEIVAAELSHRLGTKDAAYVVAHYDDGRIVPTEVIAATAVRRGLITEAGYRATMAALRSSR